MSLARPILRSAALFAACLASAALRPPALPAQSADSARALMAPPVRARIVSAPIRNVRYEVVFDDTLARRNTIRVAMTFEVAGPGPIVLSMPAWTPGAYEIANFARYVSGFHATAGAAAGRGAELDWDKVDADSWRVQPRGAKEVTVSFDVLANAFDNAGAWSKPDFAFFNGTNVFLYPEGRGFAWDARVTVRTRDDWKVATGMPTVAGAPRTFRASNYHDLVDFPVFVGRFDTDSQRIADRWVRFATYPTTAFTPSTRAAVWKQFQAAMPPLVKVFGDTPFDSYVLLQVVDSAIGGASGLEHQNSQLDLISPLGLGSPDFATFYAHEIAHAWNVKRLRPADLVPYAYDAPQPTTWLWVSEGITDYYGNLAPVRGGLFPPELFYLLVTSEMAEVDRNPPVALEDASLNAWIKSVEGSTSIYYEKGSLAGLALDIMIRDASDNRRSLDDVMRELYRTTWKRTGRGFTDADWWGTLSRAAGGLSFDEFRRRHIDGREPFPWDSLLPRAGMRYVQDTIREPRVGIGSNTDSAGVRVTEVVPGSVAAEAGVREGDVLVKVGDVPVEGLDWGTRYRAIYASRGGAKIPIIVQRDGQVVTLTATVRLEIRVVSSAVADDRAGPRALRIRNGILTGTTQAPATPVRPATRTTGGQE